MDSINSSKDVKNLLGHIRELYKSPELFLVIIILGCLIKIVLPMKIDILISSIKLEYLIFIGAVIDLLLVYLLIICSFLFVFHLFTVVVHALISNISENSSQRRNVNRNTKTKDILFRGNRGSHIRLLLLSRWLFIMFGLLFILNDSQFYVYLNLMKSSYVKIGEDFWFSFIGAFVSVVLVQCAWFAIKSIYFKYLDLYSIEGLEVHYE